MSAAAGVITEIKIADVDESGSMDFIVYGYMNRKLRKTTKAGVLMKKNCVRYLPSMVWMCRQRNVS